MMMNNEDVQEGERVHEKEKERESETLSVTAGTEGTEGEGEGEEDELDKEDREENEQADEEAKGNPLFIPDPEELEQLRSTWKFINTPDQDNDFAWNQYLDLILIYSRTHGHCNVTKATKCKLPDGTIVYPGKWLSRQRTLHQKGTLIWHRNARLQALVDQGVLFWQNSSETRKAMETERWALMYRHLVAYGASHEGDCNVPCDYVVKGGDGLQLELGKWLSAQRSSRAKTPAKYPEDRRIALQQLVDSGQLTWTNTPPGQSQSHGTSSGLGSGLGHTPVSGKTALGKHSRSQTSLDTLVTDTTSLPVESAATPLSVSGTVNATPAASATTETVSVPLPVPPSVTSPTPMQSSHQAMSDMAWMGNFNLLLEYSQTNITNDNDCNVPASHVIVTAEGKSVRLGKWLSKQRTEKRKGALQPDRLQLLQNLVDEGKLCWEGNRGSTEDKWMLSYQELLRFAEEHGNCNIPSDYTVHREDGSDFCLGSWLGKQRYYKTNSTLKQDRLEKLQALVDKGLLMWRAS